MARILYIQYTNPAGYPPLEHSSQLLANAGWQVLFLGTDAAGADVLRFPPHPNIKVRQMPFCPAGRRQKLHYARFVAWVFFWALRWRPHWIYASDLLSCPAAWLLSFVPGQKIVYHEHDSPQAKPTSRFLRWCLAARRRLARRAAVNILPNAVRAQRFTEQTGATNVQCVWNCPTTEEVGPQREEKEGTELWLLYHGSISPPQLPSTLLDAMAHLPERVKLRVIGYETVGHRGYVAELQDMAERLGITHRVEFLGSIPTRSKLLRWCGQSDVGLALFVKGGLQPMPGASNKPFDYMAHGCALLASDLPDWREMYIEPGYGLACDPEDPASIAAALEWFLDHPDQMRAMGEAGRRRILTGWNYEKAFRHVWNSLRD